MFWNVPKCYEIAKKSPQKISKTEHLWNVCREGSKSQQGSPRALGDVTWESPWDLLGMHFLSSASDYMFKLWLSTGFTVRLQLFFFLKDHSKPRRFSEMWVRVVLGLIYTFCLDNSLYLQDFEITTKYTVCNTPPERHIHHLICQR